MKSDYLNNMTPEQREANRQKGVEARKAKVEAAKLLKTDYADMKFWEDLARSSGLRLPKRYLPNTELKYLKRVCKSLGLDVSEYLESCGVNTIKQLVQLNPDWTARAECGSLLEWFYSKQ